MKPDISITRLRWVVSAFVIALMVPAVVLVWHAYSQLKWETYVQYSRLAEELINSVQRHLIDFVESEEKRSFGDFQFLVVSGDPAANYRETSPLAQFPLATTHGCLGYFQVDAGGNFSSPLLPATVSQASDYGVTAGQLVERQRSIEALLGVLQDNRLVSKRAGQKYSIRKDTFPTKRSSLGLSEPAVKEKAPSIEPVTVQTNSGSPVPAISSAASRSTAKMAGFDELDSRSASAPKRLDSAQGNLLGKVQDLPLQKTFQRKRDFDSVKHMPLRQKKRESRKEQTALAELKQVTGASDEVFITQKIRLFESEIEPYRFSLLNSGHFVLYRQVWRSGERYVQGALFEQKAFLDSVVAQAFSGSQLSRISQLIVAYQDAVLTVLTGKQTRGYLLSRSDLQGQVLYRSPLLSPFENLELIFSVGELPLSDSASVINYTFAVFVLVLCLAGLVFYRLGVSQLKLVRQQQDFVAAVSHELKTPLTSIRMYGEILKAGWAGEEKKQRYYSYIYAESERLSRLIDNVLQLARFDRNEIQLDLKTMTVRELTDRVRSRIDSHCENASFVLAIDIEAGCDKLALRVDPDAFVQIIINLVDNAIKFSAKAQRKAIDFSVKQVSNRVEFSIRDFGPGIPRKSMKKIFSLFYRMENELTRETSGTGIGLALVNQLALAMAAEVTVKNRDPGALFTLRLAIQ
ncbi:MAG: histidine kinase [Gammaproteobacteria bacterium]|nr:MAG: histidine kinase [Gammaproteobacteria bacterium]